MNSKDLPSSDSDRGATFDVARFFRRFGPEGHNGLMSLTYVSHSADHVELMIPGGTVTAEDPAQTVATGAIITLLDMAATLAVWSRVGAFRPHASLDFRVDHLSLPIIGDDIFGRAECYQLDDKIAFVRGSARMSGGLSVASFAGTYKFTDTK